MNPSSPKYSGKDAQLGELDTYLGDVLCRCAERAQELGYQYFGVQNHGMYEVMIYIIDISTLGLVYSVQCFIRVQ